MERPAGEGGGPGRSDICVEECSGESPRFFEKWYFTTCLTMPREYVAKGDSNALFSLLKPVAGKLEHLRLMGSETATSPSWQLDELTPVKLNRDMFQPFSVLNASPFEWTFQFFQFNWDEKPRSLLLIDHHQFHWLCRFSYFFKNYPSKFIEFMYHHFLWSSTVFVCHSLAFPMGRHFWIWWLT